jgi:hypothetical protein
VIVFAQGGEVGEDSWGQCRMRSVRHLVNSSAGGIVLKFRQSGGSEIVVSGGFEEFARLAADLAGELAEWMGQGVVPTVCREPDVVLAQAVGW